MKLLLDEHYADAIAQQLRAGGHDVVTVSEAGLKQTADETLLQIAATAERVLLTNNARDFSTIARNWAAAGRAHFGIVLTSDRTFPRGRSHVGLLVRALTDLLEADPRVDALRSQVRWLSPPSR